MADIKTIGTNALTAIIATLLVLGGVSIFSDNTYYCAEKSLVMQCDKLSSTFKTCYNAQLGNKICSLGWSKVTKDLPDSKEIISSDNNVRQYLCDNIRCVAK